MRNISLLCFTNYQILNASYWYPIVRNCSEVHSYALKIMDA